MPTGPCSPWPPAWKIWSWYWWKPVQCIHCIHSYAKKIFHPCQLTALVVALLTLAFVLLQLKRRSILKSNCQRFHVAFKVFFLSKPFHCVPNQQHFCQPGPSGRQTRPQIQSCSLRKKKWYYRQWLSFCSFEVSAEFDDMANDTMPCSLRRKLLSISFPALVQQLIYVNCQLHHLRSWQDSYEDLIGSHSDSGY